MKTTKTDGSGLVYLCIAFILYFLLGLMSVFDLNKAANIKGETIPLSYYLISGFISLSFISSLSLFVIRSQKVDTFVSSIFWKNSVKMLGFVWSIIVITNSQNHAVIGGSEICLSIISFLLLGFFIVRYFMDRNLRLIALISGIYFFLIISLQISLLISGSMDDKFIHMNSYILAPAMALSVIVLSYTFNWINTLDFHELSTIWMGDENRIGILSKGNQNWQQQIKADELEKVIDEVITLKRHKNERLDHILKIAKENTRNNNNLGKSKTSKDQYHAVRSQISYELGNLIKWEYNEGNSHLLVIGIDTYQHCANLKNAVSDAKLFTKVMVEKYQFESRLVTTLFNEKATQKGITTALRNQVKQIKKGVDNLIIYYAGHGHYDKLLDEGYWVPADAMDNAAADQISYSYLTKIIKAIPTKHTFLIVDSCYSGSMLVGDRTNVNNRLERDPSRWILASGRNEVVSDGEPEGKSPFAEELIEILDKNDKDGLRVSELVNRVTTNVSYNSHQTPIGRPIHKVGDKGGEFIFRLKRLNKS